METVSPNIFVNDIHATIAFYQLLGFTEQDSVVIPSGEKIFSLMTHGTVTFMFQTFTSIEGQHPMVSRTDGGSLLLYIKMKGIQEYFEQVRAVVPVLSGLEKTFYGATEFSVRDNNNYLLTFAEHG
ncbi:MAG: glyoxalase [Azospira oryzae]|jgi:uncharacterized glyoxalase superfamily protein PhnB|nr:MAG: glyoxalase [Azospira oryzae]